MKITIIILGSRGDVQPMVTLADGLSKKGHEVNICAPPENKELASRVNCRFVAFGPNVLKAVRMTRSKTG
jgi:UDP:flavonoid glycosyltransferase YjiC (YdhE family)